MSALFELVTCPHCGLETRKMKFCGNCGKPLRAVRVSVETSWLKRVLFRVLDYLAACGRDRKKLYNLMLAIVLVPLAVYVLIIVIIALLGSF